MKKIIDATGMFLELSGKTFLISILCLADTVDCILTGITTERK